MPLLTDRDVLGVDDFATHRLPIEEAAHAYEIFQKKQDGAIKILLKPGMAVGAGRVVGSLRTQRRVTRSNLR